MHRLEPADAASLIEAIHLSVHNTQGDPTAQVECVRALLQHHGAWDEGQADIEVCVRELFHDFGY